MSRGGHLYCNFIVEMLANIVNFCCLHFDASYKFSAWLYVV